MLYETYKLGKLKKSPVQRFYTREELESYELPRLKEICRAESIKPPSVETFYNKQKMVALLYKYLGIVKKDMITLYSEKGCIFLKEALKKDGARQPADTSVPVHMEIYKGQDSLGDEEPPYIVISQDTLPGVYSFLADGTGNIQAILEAKPAGAQKYRLYLSRERMSPDIPAGYFHNWSLVFFKQEDMEEAVRRYLGKEKRKSTLRYSICPLPEVLVKEVPESEEPLVIDYGTSYTTAGIYKAGDHIVCGSAIYGGTFNLFGVTMKKLGIDCTFVDVDAPEEEIAKAFRPNTKAVFAETIANPALVVLDIEKFAKLAHDHQVPLIVDNTFATPVNCRPFEWGADIVTHSTTKYMDGHAMQVGGAIVDSGNFDWTAYGDKYHGLTQPDESYHGVVYTERFGKAAYITKATVQLMRDLGSIPSPQNCFLLNVGLETLPLRVERHCYNAQKVAEFLSAHEKVTQVSYAGLPGDKYHELAQKYMPNGTCGVISFEVAGGRDGAVRFMDSLKLAAIVTHVADARTSVLHPASHTHRQMNDQQLVEAGVSPGMIRFSVGIENVQDIIADLEQALANV